MTELEQLEQAIAALEARRATLGDAVVEVALGPMREKLVELHAQLAPEEIEAGLERGKALQLESVVAEILQATEA